MSDELKPCPFCGSDAEIVAAIESGADVPFVTCKNPDCGAATPCFHYPNYAVNAWNNGPRTPNDLARVTAERDRLKRLVESAIEIDLDYWHLRQYAPGKWQTQTGDIVSEITYDTVLEAFEAIT